MIGSLNQPSASGPTGCETLADFDTFHGIDSNAGGGKLGIQLGIDGRAPARRNARRNAFDNCAEAVAGGTRLVEHRFPSALVTFAADLDNRGGNIDFRDD